MSVENDMPDALTSGNKVNLKTSDTFRLQLNKKEVKNQALSPIDNIPKELREYNHWVTWKLEGSSSPSAKPTKVPYNARTGIHASSTDPSTWSTFEEVAEAYKKGNYSGISFMLDSNDPFTGIDLDSVVDPQTGKIEDWAQDIIDQMSSYTEISPSGKGIRIFIRAIKPEGLGSKGGPDNRLEIYDRKRQLTVTGNIYNNVQTEIKDRQEELESLCRQYLSQNVTTAGPQGLSVGLVLRQDAIPPQARFIALLDSNQRFRQTWRKRRDGELTSPSEYDMALAGFARRDGWSDQEIANLIIAWRREHRENPNKALRPDYIPRILSAIKADKQRQIIETLGFEVKQFVQIGTEQSRYIITTSDDKDIRVDSTASLTSPKRMGDLLLEAGYVISRNAIKAWPEIVAHLHSMVEVQKTATVPELAREWVLDMLLFMTPAIIDPNTEGFPHDIYEVICRNPEQIALDLDGRLFFRMTNNILMDAYRRFGEDGRVRKLGATLRELGFEKREKLRTSKRRGVTGFNTVPAQVNVWVSPKGFVQADLVKEHYEIGIERLEERRHMVTKFKAIEASKEAVAAPGPDIEDDPFDKIFKEDIKKRELPE